MSMISDLVDRLRVEAKSMGTYGTDYMATLLTRSADTIEMLSEKARESKEVVMPKKCKGCDSASKIIEAYSRGFEDGADAVKAMPSTECRMCKHFKDRPNCGWECEYDTFEECNYEPKDEPFDKDINVRSKDEPKLSEIPTSKCEPKTEPQTCSVNGRPYDCGKCEYFRCTADETQTERSE